MDLSPEEGARVVALKILAGAVDAAGALAAGAGEEPLHDFRVALRRLRSTLRTYRPWLGTGVLRKHERRLRKIARSTNAARDAEVQLAWLADQRESFAVARRQPGWQLLVSRYESRAHGETDAAKAAERFSRTGERLHRRLGTYERVVDDAGAGASFASVLASLVQEQHAALSKRIEAIRDASDQETVHRARIEGKRLRYLLEPLRGYEPADAGEAVAHLKRLQDLLGDLHDAHVLADEIREALVDAAAERARHVHATAYGRAPAAVRDSMRSSPRPGLLSLVALARERRDVLFADLERSWRGSGMERLAAEVGAIVAALEERAGGRLEHERKLLLSAVPQRALEEDEGVEIVQGWLPGARLRERIRRVRGGDGERYWRAVKRGSGVRRLEAEEETTREIFDALWPLTEGRRVTKRRHRVPDGDLVWEIDAFTDRDLVVAEVELPARATDVAIPGWLQPLVVREVTGDPAYSNENLAATPGAPVAKDEALRPPASRPASDAGSAAG